MNNFERIEIPFTSDYGFKATFGNEKNTLFLRRALQVLIKSKTPIREVVLGKNTIEGYTPTSRGGVYDLACTDIHGNEFIVEMQLAEFPGIVQRAKFYAFHKFDQLILRGKYSFVKLPKVYCITILGQNLFDDERFYRRAWLRDEKNKPVDEQLEFIFVELEKFVVAAENCTTDLEKLIFTMKEAHKNSENGQKPEFMQEDWLEVAIRELDSRRKSQEEYSNLAIAVAREQSQRWWEEEKERRTAAAIAAAEAAAATAVEAAAAKAAEKAAAEAAAKAEAEKEETITNVIQKTGWDDEKIADVLGYPIELVKAVRKKIELKTAEN